MWMMKNESKLYTEKTLVKEHRRVEDGEIKQSGCLKKI